MLDDLFANIWQSLDKAQPSPFKLLQAATIGLDGTPKVRTVVLREASPEQHRVTFFTDKRSAKAAELQRNPCIALTGFDAALHVQLRLEGVAALNTDDADIARYWQACQAYNRVLYQSPVAPGTALSAPSDIQIKQEEHCAASEDGYENFCVVQVSLAAVEWLSLSPEGYQRAAFKRDGATWAGHWIAP
ncbi:pyridoxamine 5'-phosphate oxidase family protein [Marinobacterium rhizophilum]|uniref:Pyridoxamine 5'-phosphate oxidase family protein n=1 Tax=Marinobacterium rhizophilum TaxID=420402 RepID=A0ABY5HMI6_9GAMM|nr:pyridoxamine 5'-phosphate oxidase family protein [Marinobacterium rhizophilum]UTW13091.1 pyridoxamine 5'-phosphate oxidase family protein [Marinobacterium rhizophilum]